MSSNPYEAPRTIATGAMSAGVIDLLTYRWTVVLLNGISIALCSVPILMYPDAPNVGLTALMVYPGPILGLSAFAIARRPKVLLFAALAVNLVLLLMRLPSVYRLFPHIFSSGTVFLLGAATIFALVLVPAVTSATCFLRWRAAA